MALTGSKFNSRKSKKLIPVFENLINNYLEKIKNFGFRYEFNFNLNEIRNFSILIPQDLKEEKFK